MMPFTKSAQSPRSWQLTKLAVALGANLMGFSTGTSYDAGTIGNAVKTHLAAYAAYVASLAASGGSALVSFIQSGTGATTRTLESKVRDSFNVKDFGAVGDGVTDDSAAIQAADDAACAGTLDWSGNTVQAEREVYFPPGHYRASNLNYRGAPWRGAGNAVTFLEFNHTSGAAIDAEGTNSARKVLSISHMTLDGADCTGTSAYGILIGYNQRSLEALKTVRIVNFPGPGIRFGAPCWMMNYYDVYIANCSRNTASLRTGIYIDPAIGALELLAFNWYGLWLEDNGFAGSAVGGGMDISTNAVDTWNFYGGTWEGNYGIGEVRFASGINVHVNGIYLESFAARVVNGFVFTDVFGSLTNCKVGGENGMTGDGLKVSGASTIKVEKLYSNIKWVNDISLSGTSTVEIDSSAVLLFSVGSGCTLHRKTPRGITLTDAATITINAAEGTYFTVTLSDNRTMGAPTNPSVGQVITHEIIQEGTLGAHTLAWNAVYKNTWSNSGNTAGKRSTIVHRFNGTNWVQVGAQSPYV